MWKIILLNYVERGITDVKITKFLDNESGKTSGQVEQIMKDSDIETNKENQADKPDGNINDKGKLYQSIILILINRRINIKYDLENENVLYMGEDELWLSCYLQIYQTRLHTESWARGK